MKILYAIQGTGNGHVSRAREVIPTLKRFADVDVFLSGGNSNLELPFEVNYKSKGLSFDYGKSGSLSYFNTLRKLQPTRIWREIRDFPIQQYDLVLNDFECISAYAAKLRGVPCMSFSHQASLLSTHAPRPSGFHLLGETILSHYAPADYAVGLHFQRYDDSIFTPIIRKEIRQLNPIKLGHYTVYLPAVGNQEILNMLTQIPDVRWEVFSRNNRYTYMEKNVCIRPIQNDMFIHSLSTCRGLLTSAGFEAPAEALFLDKKLFVIPIGGQYEQACNAAALNELGVSSGNFGDASLLQDLQNWVTKPQTISVNFPDITNDLVEQIVFDQAPFFVPGLAAGW